MSSLIRRIAEYSQAVCGGIRVRYLLVFSLSHLVPRFTAAPLVARLYRLAGFEIGRGTSFGGPLRVVTGRSFDGKLVIGRDVLIAMDVTINLDDAVHIGDSVSVGPCVKIYTASHPIGPGSRRMMGEVASKPVTIERGAWIRLGALILPGVTVGHGSIVGAGSVVTTDVPPNTYVEGNPAKVARSLPWEDQ